MSVVVRVDGTGEPANVQVTSANAVVSTTVPAKTTGRALLSP